MLGGDERGCIEEVQLGGGNCQFPTAEMRVLAMGKDSQGARTGIHRYAWGYMGSCISATNPRTDGMSQTGKSHCGLICPCAP